MWENELGWVSIWMCDLLKTSLLWHWGFVFCFSFSYLRWADKIYCPSLSSGLIVTPVTNSSVTIGFHRFSQFHNLGGLWLWQKLLKIFCSSEICHLTMGRKMLQMGRCISSIFMLFHYIDSSVCHSVLSSHYIIILLSQDSATRIVHFSANYI